LVENPLGECLLGKSMRWHNNIIMDLRKVGCEDERGMDVAQGVKYVGRQMSKPSSADSTEKCSYLFDSAVEVFSVS
jgi:hypothetical protein